MEGMRVEGLTLSVCVCVSSCMHAYVYDCGSACLVCECVCVLMDSYVYVMCMWCE